MNPLRLKAKRFLYSLRMLPAALLVTVGLVWSVYRTGVFLNRAEGSAVWVILSMAVSLAWWPASGPRKRSLRHIKAKSKCEDLRHVRRSSFARGERRERG